MWFADVGLGIAVLVLVCWLGVIALAATLSRLGHPALSAVLAPPTRVPVLVGTGAAVLLFAAQAGVVDTIEDRAGTGPLDRSAWAWFVAHRGPGLTGVMTAVSRFGGTAGMAVLALVGAIVLWRWRRRGEAGAVVGAAVGAGLLVTGFKNLYGRARPPVLDRLGVATNFSLPSGHALGSVVVLGVLAAVTVLLTRRLAVRVTAVAAAAAGIVTIGVSRLYLGVHWLTDVLTGWLLGGAWLALCVTALVLLQHRSRPSTSSKPGPGATADPGAEGSGDGAAVPAAGR